MIQFNIHKNGRITDVVVVQPSDIDAFNRASYNAILGSNPTEPLPPEYPEPKAFFTVTFSYNEHRRTDADGTHSSAQHRAAALGAEHRGHR